LLDLGVTRIKCIAKLNISHEGVNIAKIHLARSIHPVASSSTTAARWVEIFSKPPSKSTAFELQKSPDQFRQVREKGVEMIGRWSWRVVEWHLKVRDWTVKPLSGRCLALRGDRQILDTS